MSEAENNKRIAKNTLLLYFRMLFMMGISLYTSRVVLNTLGVEDFGIYNVVGGVVVMFSFLNSSMTNATQRFLTFAIGKGDKEKLNKIFSTSVMIHVSIALIVLILGETIGLWFLKSKMTIPLERAHAAMWVYQMSVISTMVLITSVPFNALIIAHEKMSAFAYISIAEAIFKLVIVFILTLTPFDKLIVYSTLLMTVSIIIRIIYSLYSANNFPEAKFKLNSDKKLISEILNFAGWNLWGNISWIALTQGLNILLNVFFNPTINAARGIAVQVQTAINSFSLNFQMALNPQITKSYAQNNLDRFYSLIFNSSKYSFYLLFLLSLPVLLETELILTLWLKIVPARTVWFLRIILLTTIVDAISNPLMTAAQATGRIKKYQIVVSSILLCIVPISYVFLKIGTTPETVFIVHLVIANIAFLSRLWMLRSMTGLPIKQYWGDVFYNIGKVTTIGFIPPIVVTYYMQESFSRLIVTSLVSTLSILLSIYTLGLSVKERNLLKDKIHQRIKEARSEK